MSKNFAAKEMKHSRAGGVRLVMVVCRIIAGLICAAMLFFSSVTASLAASAIDYQSLQENPIDTAFRRILAQEIPDWDEVNVTGGAISGWMREIKWPLKTGKIAELFNLRASKGNRRHTGVDLTAPKDTLIYAVLDGVVDVVSNGGKGWSGYGRVVFINHGSQFWSLYSHCNQIKVKIGQKVKTGEVIATVGATGRANGYHLHFELRNSSGTPIDPMSQLPREGTLSR